MKLWTVTTEWKQLCGLYNSFALEFISCVVDVTFRTPHVSVFVSCFFVFLLVTWGTSSLPTTSCSTRSCVEASSRELCAWIWVHIRTLTCWCVCQRLVGDTLILELTVSLTWNSTCLSLFISVYTEWRLVFCQKNCADQFLHLKDVVTCILLVVVISTFHVSW